MLMKMMDNRQKERTPNSNLVVFGGGVQCESLFFNKISNNVLSLSANEEAEEELLRAPRET